MSIVSATSEASQESQPSQPPTPLEPVEVQEVHPLVCKVSHGHEENILPTLSSEPTFASQEDLEVAEHNRVVKDDSFDLELSRGFPIRYLALQQVI